MTEGAGPEESVDVDSAGRAQPLLVAAALCLATAFGLLFLVHGEAGHAAGWVLGSLVVTALVAAYRWRVLRWSLDRSYVHRPDLDRAASGLIVLGMVVAAGHLWPLATELSR